jgi:DNA-binding response OmpR family regulator
MHVPLSRDPVVRPEGFYGRKPELRWLGDQLGRAYPQNVNIVGEPRSGRTSLLSQVIAWQMGRMPRNEIIYLLLQVVTLPERTSLRFWQYFWRQLVEDGRAHGLNWPTPQAPAESWELFAEIEGILRTLNLQHGVKRMLILIDDFDHLYPNIQRRDLDWMLVLATQFRQELGFAITSSVPLSEIEKAIVQKENPAPWQPVAQFSSNFKIRWLNLLSEKEARSLCDRSLQKEEAETLSEEELQFLLAETGPHPDLLKVGLSYILEARENGGAALSDVRSDIRLDDHAIWLCRQLWLRRTPAEQAVLQSLIQQNGEADPFILEQLQKKASIVLRDQESFRCFSNLFAHWIDRWISHPAQESRILTIAPPAPPPEPPARMVAPPAPSPPSSSGLAETTAVLLSYDPDTRLAHNGEQEVKLTRLEGRLLSYFLQKSDQVCKTEELLENVWGAGRSRSVVEKAVNRLRQKIEIDPQRPRFILAARGEGYILRLF